MPLELLSPDDLSLTLNSQAAASANSTAIANWLASSEIQNDVCGGGLHLPHGILYIDQTITYPVKNAAATPWMLPFIIKGHEPGATIKYVGDPANAAIKAVTKFASGDTVTPNIARAALDGVRVVGGGVEIGSVDSSTIGKYFLMRDVLITQVGVEREAGLIVYGFDGGLFQDIYVAYCDTNGAKIELSHHVGFDNFACRENGGVGLYAIGGAGWYGNLYLEGNESWGWVFDGGPGNSQLHFWGENNNGVTGLSRLQGIATGAVYSTWSGKCFTRQACLMDDQTRNTAKIENTNTVPDLKPVYDNMISDWSLTLTYSNLDPSLWIINSKNQFIVKQNAYDQVGAFQNLALIPAGEWTTTSRNPQDRWFLELDIQPDDDQTWQYLQNRAFTNKDTQFQVIPFGADNLTGTMFSYVIYPGEQTVKVRGIGNWSASGTGGGRFGIEPVAGSKVANQPSVDLTYNIVSVFGAIIPYGIWAYDDVYGYDGGTLNSIVPFLQS